MAMARNDTRLRWTVVTIDNGDDAKDALDRITIPKDVLDRMHLRRPHRISKTFEHFQIARRVMMTQTRFIETILALVEGTSPVDEEALDLLARSLLSALTREPETPEALKQAAARMLEKSEGASTADVPAEGDTRD